MKYIVGQNVCLQPSVGIDDYGWAFCMKYIQQLDMLAISKPKKQNWENFLEYYSLKSFGNSKKWQ